MCSPNRYNPTPNPTPISLFMDRNVLGYVLMDLNPGRVEVDLEIYIIIILALNFHQAQPQPIYILLLITRYHL